MGFNRHFPREVVYSPRHFGGIGLQNLHCEQGISKVIHILNHIRTRTNTGRRHIINIETYQLLAGISTPILESTHPIPGTRNIWLSNLREFLHGLKCQLRLHQPWLLPPLRRNDIHLMDVVSTSTAWNDKEKEIFNTVRQYLQVTTLSELRSNDGKLFHYAAFGQLTSRQTLAIRDIYSTTLLWPTIPRSPLSAFRLWKRILQREFLHQPPLREWLYPATFQFHRWKYSLAHLIHNQTKLWIDNINHSYSVELNPKID